MIIIVIIILAITVLHPITENLQPILCHMIGEILFIYSLFFHVHNCFVIVIHTKKRDILTHIANINIYDMTFRCEFSLVFPSVLSTVPFWQKFFVQIEQEGCSHCRRMYIHDFTIPWYR